MKTRILACNSNGIKQAAKIIKKGGLVAFPTETVYGLGADGLNKKAVKKIFFAKGRPQDNPLILHISQISEVQRLVKDIPENAQKLIKEFWPGPLTLVMKKSELVPDIITAGLGTVAVRMPKNKVARQLIRESGCPIAAPSANLSGKPSPTTTKHVLDDLDGKIEAVIDGGEVEIGIESTVIDMTNEVPQILRPGRITQEQLRNVVVKVNKKGSNNAKPRSPGMKYKHYSPKARVVIVENSEELDKTFDKNQRIKFLKYKSEVEMGKNLFKDFRDSDEEGYDLIVVWPVKDKGFGSAIMDRLRKASG